MALLLVGQLVLTWQSRRAGRRSAVTMVEIVTER